jgi:hypothetical protein
MQKGRSSHVRAGTNLAGVPGTSVPLRGVRFSDHVRDGSRLKRVRDGSSPDGALPIGQMTAATRFTTVPVPTERREHPDLVGRFRLAWSG